MKRNTALEIVKQVQEAVSDWPEIAEGIKIPDKTIKQIRNAHRNLIE
jgi:hypothetical protein